MSEPMSSTASMKVACVAGARPNFMKIKPVLDALEARGHEAHLIHTGQHYDAAMSDVFFDDLGLRKPDLHLNVGSGSHAEQTSKVMVAFEEYVNREQPDWTVVVGDVNSTLACALVGAKADCQVAHVEAGLRSRDWSMPEEVNRVVTDRVSDLLLAPSPDGVENLLAEGVHPSSIELVGNVMIDTLLANVDRAIQRPILDTLGVRKQQYCLLTLHRPSNVDDPAVLAGLLQAANVVAERLTVVFPAHPRTRQKLAGHEVHRNIVLAEPAGYLDFIAMQAGAKFVMSDSGGVQEETTALGVPCLTLRTTTERPITITQGTNQLVGVEPVDILVAVDGVFNSRAAARSPKLWDGAAGARVAEAIESFEGADDTIDITSTSKVGMAL